MDVATRTPDGDDGRCSVCGRLAHIAACRPPGDAPCPFCGSLIWFRPTPIETIAAGPTFSYGVVRNRLETRRLNFWYGPKQVLFDVHLCVPDRSVLALIGPSGSGKSTFLRTFNCMNEEFEGTRREGDVLLDGHDVNRSGVDRADLRQRVAMVFQTSYAFPTSIYENVAFGLRAAGRNDRACLQTTVERCLQQSALWDEVKDQLHDSALSLSGNQQQRLCIARALATDPEVLLMDEPCSSLDPANTTRIEDLIFELRKRKTIVIVTQDMKQAARVSDNTAFFFQGKLIEVGPTDQIYTRPVHRETLDYVTRGFAGAGTDRPDDSRSS